MIEDTHLTLIGILSKVEANNSNLFLRLQTYEKKFAEFSFLFIFIIPCLENLLKPTLDVSSGDKETGYIERSSEYGEYQD